MGSDNDNQGVRSQAEVVLHRYWRTNLWMTGGLLILWGGLGLGAGVLAADWLNQWKLPGTGYPLGFWFAQQGAIVGFVVIILVYAFLMNRLDRRHHDELLAAGTGVEELARERESES